MAKDRQPPKLDSLVMFLRGEDAAIPDPLRPDAERARDALGRGETGALAALAREVQLAAVEALAAASAVDALRRLEDTTAVKDVRKAVGKALHKLRTRGVEVGEGVVRGGESFRFHTVEGEQPRSYASLTDPEGDRMVWFGHAVPNQGRMAFQAVCNERNGVVLFQVFPQMTAKMRRRILEELAGGKIAVFEVENEQARWLIEEAIQANHRTGTDIPKEYFEAERLLGPAPDRASDPHPIYQTLLQGGGAGEPTPAEIQRGAELFTLEEVGEWRPGGEIMDKLKEELLQAEDGVLVLTEVQQRERLQSSIDRAIREYFDADQRELWLRRLQDLAMYLVGEERVELGRVALAAGEELAKPDTDATAVPFATELFFRWLTRKEEPAPAEGAEDEDDDDDDGESRIITP